MTFYDKLAELKQEISSAKAQYSALHKEIDKRVLKGEDITNIQKERDEVFIFYNTLLRNHQQIIQHLTNNKLKAHTKIPDGFRFF